MPDFSYQPKTVNDKSQLSPGWHPAYLVQIADEETPIQWEMAKQSPRLWRWQFAVWETPAHIASQIPELQSTPTTQKFSPGGKYQASKAYVFTRKLLNRQIESGEHINLDTLMPLPCQVLVSRTDKNGVPIEYANITDLQPWPDGNQSLTPDVRTKLLQWLEMKQAGGTPQGQTPTPPPAQTPPPSWNTPSPSHMQPTAAGTTKPGW